MISPIGRPKILHNKGLTFIELILVAIIIAVLVGLSTPLFKTSFSGLQLKRSCQKLVQLMRYAQAKSIAEREVTRLNLDFDKSTFWLSAQGNNSSAEFKLLAGRWGKVHTITEAITIEPVDDLPEDNETAYISFYPDGSIDQAKIKISDEKENGFIITTQRTIRYAEIEK
jgi:Tfp pilus assembly protein FimT